MRSILLSGMSRVMKKYYLLGLAFAVAFILRALQVGNGLPYLHYWDEPQTVSYALGMLREGTLNPHFYSYGSLPIYLSAFVDTIYFAIRHALPVSSPYHMASMDEVKIAVDTGWYWDVSHPGFVYWNRMLTALMSAGMVVFTYLIVQRIFQNKWLSFTAALFLAVIPFHITHGIRTTPDTPVAFFVIVCTYYALRYKQEKLERDFIVSLIAMGCAVAVKYNSGLVGLMPLAAFLLHWRTTGQTPSPRQFAILFLVPPLTFVLAMPYSVIEVNDFVAALLREFNHYSVAGHGPDFTSEPGLSHMLFQLRTFNENIGAVASLIILFGVGAAYYKRDIAFLLIYPFVFFLFMTSMKVNFHRNYVQLYPFLSVFFVCGLFVIHKFLRRALIAFLPQQQNAAVFPVIIVVFILLGQKSFEVWPKAWAVAIHTETRSVIIDELNAQNLDIPLYLSRELHFQAPDLNRLRHKYEIVDALALPSCEISTSEQALFVLPTHLALFQNDISQKLQSMKNQKRKKTRLQRHLETQKAVKNYQSFIRTGFDLTAHQSDNSGITYVDAPSINPKITLKTLSLDLATCLDK